MSSTCHHSEARLVKSATGADIGIHCPRCREKRGPCVVCGRFGFGPARTCGISCNNLRKQKMAETRKAEARAEWDRKVAASPPPAK